MNPMLSNNSSSSPPDFSIRSIRFRSMAPPAADADSLCFHVDGSDRDHNPCPHCKGPAPPSPSPSSSPYSFVICETNSDKLNRIIFASVKGFTIGAGLKGGLSLFSLLVRLSRQKSRTSLTKRPALSTGEEILLLIKETLRYSFFLGTFAGTFVTVDELIATLGGHRRTARWRALLAGAIAGPSMLLTGLETTHTSLAIYILIRAVVLTSRCGIKSKRFGRICKPLTWKYVDIFLMCLSSSHIL